MEDPHRLSHWVNDPHQFKNQLVKIKKNMNTLILTSLCALALNASAKPAATDTVDMYVIDNEKIEKFDGSQLVGKTIVSYDVMLAKGKADNEVIRTHAITTLSGRLQSLKGQLSGLHIQDGTAVKGQDAEPLYIIDGSEADPHSLDPVNIVSIDVCKPGSEKALSYGEKGRNGVVVIATSAGSRMKACSSSPVIVIDGKTSASEALSSISPEDIVSVTVYKNREDVLRYTDDPSKGVIVVETRRK